MQQQVDTGLLQLYFQGKCTREQLVIIQEYLRNEEYRESLEAFLEKDWKETMSAVQQPVLSQDEQYQHFLRVVKGNDELKKSGATRIRRFAYRKVSEIAAALILLISVAAFAWLHKNNKQEQAHFITLLNDAGRRTVFYLPDSSQVYLGAASTLDYNIGYGTTNRDISLHGEAYFIVKHGGRQPFSVTTGKITTVDIGTEFNIRSLQHHPAIEVTVATGLVDVIDNKNAEPEKITRLSARQLLRYDTASGRVEIENLDREDHVGAWREGLLTFKRQSLKEVVEELQRYYGLTIRFTNPEHEKIIITTTLRNATVSEALEIIALTAGVKIERRNNDAAIL